MMERREVLAAAAGGIAAVVLVGRDGFSAATANAANQEPANDLARAAAECAVAGEACLQHCLVLLAQGDKSLGDCGKAVTQMIAICEAMSSLSAQNSAYAARLAKLCVEVCSDCEKACRPHADHHAVCKACADACLAAIAQARKIAA